MRKHSSSDIHSWLGEGNGEKKHPRPEGKKSKKSKKEGPKV